jgi:hypothetical protein
MNGSIAGLSTATGTAVKNTTSYFEKMEDSAVTASYKAGDAMVEMLDKIGNKAESTFAKMSDAIDGYREKLLRQAFETSFYQNPDNRAQTKPTETMSIIGGKMADVRARLGEKAFEDKAYIEYKAIYDAEIKGMERAAKEAQAKIDKRKEEEFEKWKISKGLIPKEGSVFAKSPNTDPLAMSDILGSVNNLSRLIAEAKKITDDGEDPTKAVALLKEADAVLARISKNVINSAGKLSASDQERVAKLIDKSARDIVAVEDKMGKAVAKRQSDELDHIRKIYNMKVKGFNAEIDRLDKLINKYNEFNATLVERRASRVEDRRGAEYTYRSTRTRAEEEVSRIQSIQDPQKALDAAKEFTKLIDRMMSSGKEAGYGNRASRIADDLEEQIAEVMKRKKISMEGQKDTQVNNIDNAVAKFKADMASNPVAQAALAQAMVVMKEAVGKAAENGIGVAGDLIQDIKIPKIDVNLPVKDFENQVRAIAAALKKSHCLILAIILLDYNYE